MARYVKTVYVLFVLAGLIILNTCSKEEKVPTQIEPQLEEEVLSLVNTYRKSNDMDTLVIHDFLTELAREHSQKMAEGKTDIGHDGFENRVDLIIKEIGGGYVAENVAAGINDVEIIINGWLESEGHRINIEGDYYLTGIGVVTGKNDFRYYTQIFLKINHVTLL